MSGSFHSTIRLWISNLKTQLQKNGVRSLQELQWIVLLPSSALKGLQTFCTAIVISLQNKRLPRWPFLMLHRGRDTSEVCLGSRQRNIQLLISLTLPELVETSCWYGQAHNWTWAARASGDNFQPKALLPAWQAVHITLSSCKGGIWWEKDPLPLLQSHAQVPTMAQGSPDPSNLFLKKIASLPSKVQPQQKHLWSKQEICCLWEQN